MADDVYVHPKAMNDSQRVGAGTRIWAYAHVMEQAVVGRDCNIGEHCFVENGAVLGDGVTVKNGVAIWEGVTLENYTFAGPNVVFTNDRLPRSPRGPLAGARYEDKGWLEKTVVREGASLGANATIVCGVTIGRYALVAAGAVVTRDVPDFCVVAGCPAKQRGHVCACGKLLPSGGSLACAACGCSYRALDEGLELLDSKRGE